MNHPLKILLVDDNQYFLDVARDYLQLQGRIDVVGFAREGKEALARALELQPDIILLDLNLGAESGLTLVPVFKKHLPATKIVILTIMLDEGYRAPAMQAGADAFVHKLDMDNTLFPVIFGLMDHSP